MKHAVVKRALRAFCRRTPFAPFAIEMVTGNTIVVTHPEAVIFDEKVMICREADRIHRVFDSTSICQFHDLPRSRPPS